ncbi:MAG: heme ABC transporter permease [Alphaproteobacteria bacterium]
MSGWHRFANPSRFARISAAVLPWAIGLTLILLAAGLYLSLIWSPPDYQQGDSVRIMYVHVPGAWMALAAYVMMAVFSAMALIWKHPLSDIAAKSCAPLGAGFTVIALTSGALWGEPMWGTWWEWGDARLTSVFVLLLLYLGYMALWQVIEDPTKAARAAAILALVGVINVPIIHFSVEWWNTLHQPASVLRQGGPAIAAPMLLPLFVMAAAFKTFFLTALLWRIRSEVAERRVRSLQMMQASTS